MQASSRSTLRPELRETADRVAWLAASIDAIQGGAVNRFPPASRPWRRLRASSNRPWRSSTALLGRLLKAAEEERQAGR
jgi:hypothetical protein